MFLRIYIYVCVFHHYSHVTQFISHHHFLKRDLDYIDNQGNLRVYLMMGKIYTLLLNKNI